MRLDLNAQEVHWLHYALIKTVAELDPSSQARTLLQGILDRLEENNQEGDRRGSTH